MTVYYISPSVFPSRSANSIHVSKMCNAIADIGCPVHLFVKRDIQNEQEFIKKAKSFYGLNGSKIKIISVYSIDKIADNLKIAILAFFHYLFSIIFKTEPHVIISRNLYAAFFIGVLLRKDLVFETHQPETGFRGVLQNLIMKCSCVKSVVISNALYEILRKRSNSLVNRCIVLHDAADSDIPILTDLEKKELKTKIYHESSLQKYPFLVGYFGHLYSGRGLGIIRRLAKRFPEIGFVLFGGNKTDILREKLINDRANLVYMGYVDPATVHNYMRTMDVLLMPYQNQVSVGVTGLNTAAWMSPMKMFEYMASGVPIISSRLPVLEEVLVNEHNALLADPENVKSWADCLEKAINDPDLSTKISRAAYFEYQEKYNWRNRANNIIQFVQGNDG